MSLNALSTALARTSAKTVNYPAARHHNAPSVTVLCEGIDACKGNVELDCGSGDCAISCVNTTSCEGIDVEAEDATSFQCTGFCDVSEDIPDSFSRSTLSPETTSTSTSSTE